MEGNYVIAIDVGIKNLGLCIFDFLSARVVVWECESLVPNGRYLPSNNVSYVRSFVKRYKQYFDSAAVVLIERQIRCNMRIIEAILHSLYFDKCLVISARDIKVHYNLSMKNYRANKQKAVQWVTEFISVNANAFVDGAVSAFKAKNKQDDLADSLLLLMFYLDTYSNQYSETLTFADVLLQDGLVL